jgi:hypothetical protein
MERERGNGVVVSLNRLLESSRIDTTELEWDGHIIKMIDVDNALAANRNGAEEPYGDGWGYPPKEKTRQYHIDRVVYFVRHPEKIVDIQIDNETDGLYTILPIPIVVDGWHRLMAATYLGLNAITIQYSGRNDVLDYLSGRSNDLPA